MVEHPNEALVRRVYAAFNAGDFDTMRELFAPDVIWNVAGNSRISGEHRGQDSVFQLFTLVGELTGGNLKLEPRTIEAQGDDTVLATHRVWAKRNGNELDVVETENITIREGKVTRFDETVDDQRATDEFWS